MVLHSQDRLFYFNSTAKQTHTFTFLISDMTKDNDVPNSLPKNPHGKVLDINDLHQ